MKKRYLFRWASKELCSNTIQNLPHILPFWSYLIPSGVHIWYLHVKRINQVNRTAPIRSPVCGRTGFQKWGVCGQAFPSFPTPSLLLSRFCPCLTSPATELLSPHFSWPEYESSFAWSDFIQPLWECLLRRLGWIWRILPWGVGLLFLVGNAWSGGQILYGI